MFSSSSFAKASFSVNAFKMAQDTDTARSGYWRLFYYNMQAESEAKRHSVVEAAKPQAKVAARKVVRSLPTVPAKVNIEPIPVMPVALMPFVLKPIHQPAALPEYTPIGYDQTWVQLVAVMRTTAVPRAMQPRIEAINDDEECVEVLLLLAA